MFLRDPSRNRPSGFSVLAKANRDSLVKVGISSTAGTEWFNSFVYLVGGLVSLFGSEDVLRSSVLSWFLAAWYLHSRPRGM